METHWKKWGSGERDSRLASLADPSLCHGQQGCKAPVTHSPEPQSLPFHDRQESSQTMSPSKAPPLVAPVRYLTTVIKKVTSTCVPVVLRGGAFGKSVGLNEDMRVVFMMALVALYKEGKCSELVHWFCLTTQRPIPDLQPDVSKCWLHAARVPSLQES